MALVSAGDSGQIERLAGQSAHYLTAEHAASAQKNIPMDQQAGSQRPTPVNPGVISLPWRDLWLLLVLFIAFRAMTLFAFRPGGLVLDYSDFYYYRDYAQTTRQGYFPFINLWAPYPPRFPLVDDRSVVDQHAAAAMAVCNWWFTLLLGGILLLFESGNLVLVYAIAGRLGDSRSALRSAGFYALLFAPVYTGTGWFDSLPIFFFLLGVYLLLRGRPLWSALVCGVGFMTQDHSRHLVAHWTALVIHRSNPLVRIPSTHGTEGHGPAGTAAAHAPVAQRLPGHPPRAAVSGHLCRDAGLDRTRLLFGQCAPGVGVAAHEPNARALADVVGAAGGQLRLRRGAAGFAPSQLGGPYPSLAPCRGRSSRRCSPALIYSSDSRPFDWKQPRNVVAITGFTVTLFMPYSKGYSPQFLGWVLVFIALLLPNLRGAFYAVVLGLANLIEANLFFTIVPDEHWLLMLTVGLRTLIFVLVSIECVFVLRPGWLTPVVQRTWHWLLVGLAAVMMIGSVPAGVRFVQAYFDVRHQCIALPGHDRPSAPGQSIGRGAHSQQ